MTVAAAHRTNRPSVERSHRLRGLGLGPLVTILAMELASRSVI